MGALNPARRGIFDGEVGVVGDRWVRGFMVWRVARDLLGMVGDSGGVMGA